MSTILIIEDTPAMAKMLVKAMASAGFRTVTATTGRAGLDLLLKRPTDFGLAIIDLLLPDIGGAVIAAKARAAGVGVPLIAISGNVELEPYQSVMFVKEIGKPFRVSALIEVVREYARGETP